MSLQLGPGSAGPFFFQSWLAILSVHSQLGSSDSGVWLPMARVALWAGSPSGLGLLRAWDHLPFCAARAHWVALFVQSPFTVALSSWEALSYSKARSGPSSFHFIPFRKRVAAEQSRVVFAFVLFWFLLLSLVLLLFLIQLAKPSPLWNKKWWFRW